MNFNPDRRRFILGGAASTLILPGACGRVEAPNLTAKPGRTRIFTGQPKETQIWGYNGNTPGPQLRMRVGEKFRILFENQIPQPTSIHWHGLRIPFEMDGVGSITQPGIEPDDAFLYEFTPPDAGLFWYHPHMNSEEQISRGMFGLIVVEENNPPPADREIIWSLYDWGLGPDYQIPEKKAFQLWRGTEDYTPNTKITTNGLDVEDIVIRRGERIRLRIANTSGERRYALEFKNHNPWIIAWDGNGVTPYRLNGTPLIIGTGARVDLMLDGTGEAGASYEISDVFNLKFEPAPPWATPEEIAARKPEHLVNIIYRDEAPMRKVSDLPPATSPARNHIPEPDLSNAVPVDIELGQHLTPIEDVPKIGALASLIAEKDGVRRDHKVALWTMNGEVLLEDLESYFCIDPKPLFECRLGKSYLLRFTNKTNVDHPTHLHGHTFKMIRRNGEPYPRDSYRDTFTVFSGDTVEVAFVADNPGDWMIHCHRGLHQHSGMMSLFRVS